MSKKQLFSFLKGVDALHSAPRPAKTQYRNNALKLHYPVLIDPVTKIMRELLMDPPLDRVSMLDCTLGLGGHSLSLLDSFENLYMFFGVSYIITNIRCV